MNDETRLSLEARRQSVNDLYQSFPRYGYVSLDGDDCIVMDGEFSAAEIRAIADAIDPDKKSRLTP